MKFLTIGCGSTGQRHLRILKIITTGEIIAHQTKKKEVKKLERKYHIKASS